jgi:hypothetical protein
MCPSSSSTFTAHSASTAQARLLMSYVRRCAWFLHLSKVLPYVSKVMEVRLVALSRSVITPAQSNFMAWRTTGNPIYQERAHAMLSALRRFARTSEGGYVRSLSRRVDVICFREVTMRSMASRAFCPSRRRPSITCRASSSRRS